VKYDVNDLVEMLTYRRGAGSEGEKKFIKRYLDVVPGMAKDGFGNRFKQIGKGDTCFACHTDTVHNMKSTFQWKGKTYNVDKLLGGRQEVHVKGKWAYKEDGECLGADDGTGVWICLNLLYARKPGLYIFHRAEEGGGQGSGWIVSNKPELVSHIKKMVSFDRKGYTDIITHQGWSRTASDEFANGLARQLGGGYRPDDGGVFTDSANYKDIVPECTNVAMGYFNGHTAEEKQDLVFANSLMQRLLKVNWQKLPVVRDPDEEKKRTARRNNWWNSGNNWDDYSYGYGNYGYGRRTTWGYQNYGYGESYVKKKQPERFPVYCASCGASWNTNRVPRRCPFCASQRVSKTRPKKVKDPYTNVPTLFSPEKIDSSYKMPAKRLKNIPTVSFPGRKVEYIPKEDRHNRDLKYKIETKNRTFTYTEDEVEKGEELDWSYQPQKKKNTSKFYDWRTDDNLKYPKKKKKKDFDDYWYDPTLF